MTKNRAEIRKRHIQLLHRLVRERTAELERVNERLFLANQVKGEFLAHMSKELRTPLNRIIDIANRLREGVLGRLNDDQSEAVNAIAESGTGLRTIVDRILELCTADVGMTLFLPHCFQVKEVIEPCVAELASTAAKRGIKVSFVCEGEPGCLTADECKFVFILEELVTNAVKFSARGSQVLITAREVTISGDGPRSYLEVAVADQGPGIGNEDLERIFLGFERGGPLPGNGSLGIGLALVKRFVELHGGRIWVDSSPGRGSVFTFILPREGALPAEVAAPRIMVADNDPAFVQMLAHCLKEQGYEVVTAADGLDLLNKGIGVPADLFVIDLALRGMNGIDVCLRLKSHANTRYVPVVIAAAGDTPIDRIKCARAGADGFFAKPMDVNELLAKMKSLITQKLNYEFLQRSYEIAASEASTDPMTGLFNLRQLRSSLDHELARAHRYGHCCSLALLDIDDFKEYNDRYGHLQGDEVLKQVAGILQTSIRNSDIAARYGGEEFVVIMPETGKELALLVGEKLRRGFADHPFPFREIREGGRLTISIGVATYPQDAEEARHLLDAADKALYRAKRQGKNQVVAWSGEVEAPCP